MSAALCNHVLDASIDTTCWFQWCQRSRLGPAIGLLINCDTHLGHGGQAGVGLGGSDLQQVEVVAALIVERPGQTERAALLADTEQIPRIYQQHVGKTFLLEGDGRYRGNTVKTHTHTHSVHIYAVV